MLSVSSLPITPMWVIPSDKAANEILGLANIRIRIVVKGGGINLKKTHIRFWILTENLSEKNSSKSGGVPMAIPDAKKVIIVVEIISLSRGKELNALLISRNDGNFK